MQPRLTPHPDSRCAAVRRIEVDFRRPAPNLLALRYLVLGEIENLRLPLVAHAERADELWWRTCFEAFVWPSPRKPYYELNFSPSTQWAAYQFDDYRAGMRLAEQVGQPTIETQIGSDRYELRSVIGLPELPAEKPWRVKLTAIIEDADGEKSYWAFSHPPGNPDFHHASGYAFAFYFPELP